MVLIEFFFQAIRDKLHQHQMMWSSLRWLLELTGYLIVTFCCYALGTIGLGLINFPDRPHAAAELLQDIQRAKQGLEAKGFVMDDES